MALRTHIDFETRSIADLPKLGEHAYARHPSTAPLMLAYGTDFKDPLGVDVQLVDFFADDAYARAQYPRKNEWTLKVSPQIPAHLAAALARDDIFVAHNARFEQAIWYYICHLQWGWPMPRRWSCTAARARYHGIRASLDGAASDLEIIHQKDARGKDFINEFCKPRKYKGPKANGIITQLWAEPDESPDSYAIGKEYCKTDVLAEIDVDNILPELPEFEQRIWDWDFKINTRGVPIDIEAVKRANAFSEHFTKVAHSMFETLVGYRPTQRERVLEYLQQRQEIEDLGDLRSKTLTRLNQSDFPTDLQWIIQTRLDCALASTKKLATMVRCTDDDSRARGVHLYGGAHTMRWTSKRIQVQNMKRGNRELQEMMFKFLAHPSWQSTAMLGHNGGPALDEMPSQPEWAWEAANRFIRPLNVLSMSMRGFVAAPAGKKLLAADFAQIEARVLAWLARCLWLLEAFRNKDDCYVKFGAEYMYKVPYDSCFIVADGKRKVAPHFERQRQISKSAVLGAGFGLGKDKFVAYCDNSDLIISAEEAETTIKAYRNAHPEIADYQNGLWARFERAAVMAVQNPTQRISIAGTGITFYMHVVDSERYWLVVELPSGRSIFYYRPKVRLAERWGRVKEVLSYRREWNGKSYREDTYGGKITENIVQAVARDCLAVGGLNAEAAGYEVVMLVHDETVCLVDQDFGSHADLCDRLTRQEAWVTDLPIAAEGATMQRYGK